MSNNEKIENLNNKINNNNTDLSSILKTINSLPTTQGGVSAEEIYIGPEQPDDEKVKIWIDTDENPVNLDEKQDKLISGINIKTINGQSILGEGDIILSGGGEVEVEQWYEKGVEKWI